jgi:hypothetical protein
VKTIVYFLCLIFLLTACGPSPEQQATMTSTALTATAAAWTPTPTATNTPTFTPSPTPTNTPTPTLSPTATSSPKSTQDPNRYSPPDNSFSIMLPEGWQSVDLGMEYPGLLGPRVEGIFQNLVFVYEASTFPLAFYAAVVQDNVSSTLKEFSSLSEDFLTTSSGTDYFHWVTENSQQDTRVRQVFYMFEKGDWKLTIIYTRQPGEAPEQDAIIDGIMDTIVLGP